MTMPCKPTILVLTILCLAWCSGADTNVELPVGAHNVPVADIGEPETGSSSLSGDPTVSGPDQTFSANYDGVSAAVGVANGVPQEDVSADPTGVEQAVAANTNVAQDVQPDGSILTGASTVGRRRSLLSNRRILGDLDLSGSGVSAGDSTAGVAANAYGHGIVGSDDLLDAQDNHVEPHGVDATASVDGTATTTGVEANPDCTGTIAGYNEGPDCVGVVGK